MSEPDVMPDFDSMFAQATVEPDDTSDAEKKPRRTRSDKGQPRGPRGTGSNSAKDKRLAEDLLGPWAVVIKALAMPLPTVSAVMSARAEKTTTAVVSLASPKLKEKLAKVSKLGPGTELGETVIMMLVAGFLDIGKLDPDTPLTMLTGVREYFDMTHEKVEETPSNVHNFPGATPSGFVPFPGAS